MRNSLGLMALLLAGCPEPEPPTEVEVDIEALLTVSTDWEDVDIAALERETIEVDVGGVTCNQPSWLYVPVYAWDPATGWGEGIHLEDRTFPISELSDGRPRIVNFHMEEDGTYTQVGLEWYFEPPEQREVNPPPTIFGIEMDGMMDPHTPFQFLHYDQHAWLWNYTSDENIHGYFGNFNEAMAPPSWWMDYEPTLFDSFRFLAPPTAFAEMGYTDAGACEANVGIRLNNPAISTETIDPFAPNSILVNQNMAWIGSEWTIADTGQGAPTLFGQTFQGPDGNGNFYLRLWPGDIMNPAGFFNPTHELMDCNAPPAPLECLGPP